MFIELRVPLQAFLASFRSTLKQIAISLTDPLPLSGTGVDLVGCGGGPVWLDRIQVWDGTVVDVIGDSTLELRQPIDVFIVSQPALLASGLAPTPPCWQRTIEAVFNLSAFIDANGPEMCLSFESFSPGNDVPPEVMSFLNTVVSANVPQLQQHCQALDISLLETMFSGQPPTVNAVALAIGGNDRIAVRLDFDLAGFTLNALELVTAQVQQAAQRASFVSGQFLEDDPTRDWTMQVHAFLLREAARSQLLASLDGQQDTFRLEDGPGTQFLVGSDGVGRVEVGFSGEVIDACLCAWDMIDLDVDVDTALYFSLPQPDSIHGRMEVEFDLSNIEVFCCSVTAGFLWFMVLQIWLEHDEIGGGAAVGATVAQIALGPIAIAIPFMAMAHGKGAGKFNPGGPWAKTSADGDDPLVYERDWQAKLGDLGFGKMSMTGMHGVDKASTQGLAMWGTLAHAAEHSDPRLVTTADDAFVMGFDDACSAEPTLQAQWNMWFDSAPGDPAEITTPIKLFALRILDGSDPLNQFAPHLDHDGEMAWIAVPQSSIQASYAAAPYSPQLLIATSGGVRIISVPPLPVWTSKQIADAHFANSLWRVIHCRDWRFGNRFWIGGRFNPHWSVDPGPEENILQVWDIGVRGMVAGQALRIETGTGQAVQTVRVAEAGGASWSGVLAGGSSLSMLRLEPGQAEMPAASHDASPPMEPSLRLTAAALPKALARLKAQTRGQVILKPKVDPERSIEMRQRALHPVARLDASWGVQGLLAARWNGTAALVVADRNGATLWSVDRADMPRQVVRRTLRDLRRAFLWRDAIWLVGAGRVVALLGGDAVEAGCCGEAVVDAGASGTHRFVLTARALWHSEHLDAPASWAIDVPHATLLAVHHESIAIADDTGISIHPRRGGRLDAPLERLAMRGVSRLEACDGPGDSYWATDGDGQGWRVSMTGSRVWLSAHSDKGLQRQLTARSGHLLAVANEGAAPVVLGQLGATRLLRR